MDKLIYLDYNATTPVDAEVRQAMQPFLDHLFGNPSSTHRYGTEARKAVEDARREVARLINSSPDEIIFTSGGTEAINFALKGAAYQHRSRGNHIITTQIEHPATSEVCQFLESQGFLVTYVPVDEQGIVMIDELEAAITSSTILISVMHANNETGVIQPIEQIGSLARANGILFHCDAAQSAGKITVDVKIMNVDLLSLAGHKFYAPKGIGALYVRRGVQLQKLIHGAGHEQNMRAGTENILEIAGLGAAARVALRDFEANIRQMKHTRDLLFELLKKEIPSLHLNGHPQKRLPNTLNISFPGLEANVLLDELAGIAASAGAACHSDRVDISPVLLAMKVPVETAKGTIRFSTGKHTSEKDIHDATQQISSVVKRLQPSDNQFVDESAESGNGSVKLTRFTQGLGCACKIRPQYLERILQELPAVTDLNVLVGAKTSDDAAVYRISDDTAIVQTVDFFTPIVDDPWSFGAIAAANALSDIYAMGAKPLFALNIVGFPSTRLPEKVLRDILKGASDKVAEAGVSILGGHTIDDSEPKFGMVVTGIVNPNRVLTNVGAQPGDALVLTKPIGTGVISTAVKRNMASEKIAQLALDVMITLNDKAAEAMKGLDIHACTDVTGFGLLGHLYEMVGDTNVSCEIDASRVPLIDEVEELVMAGAVPGGTRNNMEYVNPEIHWPEDIPEYLKIILCDAQTSGGLMVALPLDQAAVYCQKLMETGSLPAAIIGRFTEKLEKRILVRYGK